MHTTLKLGPLQQRWVNALTSNKYSQSRGALHTLSDNGTEGFCSIGVACNLFKNCFDIERIDDHMIYDGLTGIAPTRLKKLLKFTESGLNCLVSLNDIELKSFEEIADYVKENSHEIFYGSA